MPSGKIVANIWFPIQQKVNPNIIMNRSSTFGLFIPHLHKFYKSFLIFAGFDQNGNDSAIMMVTIVGEIGFLLHNESEYYMLPELLLPLNPPLKLISPVVLNHTANMCQKQMSTDETKNVTYESHRVIPQ
jgi:hypothetical protein